MQKAAYKGTDFIPFSKPKFFWIFGCHKQIYIFSQSAIYSFSILFWISATATKLLVLINSFTAAGIPPTISFSVSADLHLSMEKSKNHTFP